MAKPGKIIFRSPLLTFRETRNGLYLDPTREGVEAARGLLEDRADRETRGVLPRGYYGEESAMFEDAIGNGWDYVRPEDVGALTDATIISQDGFIADRGGWVPYPDVAHPKLFAHMDYAVEDPIETWARGEPVYFVKDVVQWTPAGRAQAQAEWDAGR